MNGTYVPDPGLVGNNLELSVLAFASFVGFALMMWIVVGVLREEFTRRGGGALIKRFLSIVYDENGGN